MTRFAAIARYKLAEAFKAEHRRDLVTRLFRNRVPAPRKAALPASPCEPHMRPLPTIRQEVGLVLLEPGLEPSRSRPREVLGGRGGRNERGVAAPVDWHVREVFLREMEGRRATRGSPTIRLATLAVTRLARCGVAMSAHRHALYPGGEASASLDAAVW